MSASSATTETLVHAGRIVEQGSPSQVFDHPQHERTQAFLSRVLKH